MKRIGNFLFIEQWFEDHNPEQAIVNVNQIDTVYANNIAGKQRTVIETPESKIVLTGEHNDNIIELAKNLNYDWEGNI